MLRWLWLLLLLTVPVYAQDLLAIQLRDVRDSTCRPLVLEGHPGHLHGFFRSLRLSSPSEGVFGRFYAHAYRYAVNSNLARWPVGLPEGSLQGPVMNQWVYGTNDPQLRSIMQSAIGQALLEELFSAEEEDVNNEAFTVVPPGSRDDFLRRVENPLNFSYGARWTGAWAGVSWRLMGIRLGSGFATETRRFNPVSLSYPFVTDSLFGELGVDSSGSAWLFLQSSW